MHPCCLSSGKIDRSLDGSASLSKVVVTEFRWKTREQLGTILLLVFLWYLLNDGALGEDNNRRLFTFPSIFLCRLKASYCISPRRKRMIREIDVISGYFPYYKMIAVYDVTMTQNASGSSSYFHPGHLMVWHKTCQVFSKRCWMLPNQFVYI